MNESISTEEKFPERPQTVSELFEVLTTQFRSAEHSEDTFLAAVLDALKKDGIRNHSLIQRLNENGLDLEFVPQAPLNDFLYGSESYLRKMGFEEREIEDFLRRASLW